MDTFFADKLGNMLVNIIGFVMNVSAGYIFMIIILTIGAIILIYMRFFTDLMTKPAY